MPKFTNQYADDNSVLEFGPNFQLISSNPALPPDVVAALAQKHAQLDAAMAKGLPEGPPVGWGAPAQSTHSVHNIDTFPMHFYRLAFKRVEGNDIMKNHCCPK